jgi:hypothetical protein
MSSANWNHDSFAPYIWTGSKSPVVRGLCLCRISLDSDTPVQIGSLYWYSRCNSGVQEGDGSLRATFFVQIQIARSISFATVSIVTHVNTRSCSRMQRNNDLIDYNFQRFDEALPFRLLEIQE